MSKSLIIFYVVAGAIIIFSLYLFFSITHQFIPAGIVSPISASVTDTRIDISISQSSSAEGYTGFRAKFSNGILVITLRGSYFDTPISRIIPAEISIDNIYGNIKEIYLEGYPQNKLIWKDGVIVK